MLANVFYRAYNRDNAKMMSAANVRDLTLEIEPAAGLDQILEAAYAAGASKGSSRSGVFEVQTDSGIWDREDGGKLAPGRPARFRTWSELELAA